MRGRRGEVDRFAVDREPPKNAQRKRSDHTERERRVAQRSSEGLTTAAMNTSEGGPRSVAE
eukprot:3224341-Pyramimonas_sp.AAC.1